MSNPRPSVPAIDRSPRLLIVEDELLVALIIEEMTLDIGYRVSGVAHTVPLARKEFAKRNFDVVLLDIGLRPKKRRAKNNAPKSRSCERS